MGCPLSDIYNGLEWQWRQSYIQPEVDNGNGNTDSIIYALSLYEQVGIDQVFAWIDNGQRHSPAMQGCYRDAVRDHDLIFFMELVLSTSDTVGDIDYVKKTALGFDVTGQISYAGQYFEGQRPDKGIRGMIFIMIYLTYSHNFQAMEIYRATYRDYRGQFIDHIISIANRPRPL